MVFENMLINARQAYHSTGQGGEASGGRFKAMYKLGHQKTACQDKD
jgi:hypothetical protein